MVDPIATITMLTGLTVAALLAFAIVQLITFVLSIKCPKCGSRRIFDIYDYNHCECADCGHEWKLND